METLFSRKIALLLSLLPSLHERKDMHAATRCLGHFLTLGDDGRGPHQTYDHHMSDLDARAENVRVTHPHTSDTLK